MIKSLVSSVLLLVTLVASAQACSVPSSNQAAHATPTLTEAEATNVRRTAVADVQRIIANSPPATATPPPTALARPACQDAIWWHEARSHLGEVRTVQGPVLATRPGPSGLSVLEVGQPYPDPTGFALLLPPAGAESLDGKTICAVGRITNSEGRTTMLVRDAASVVVVQ